MEEVKESHVLTKERIIVVLVLVVVLALIPDLLFTQYRVHQAHQVHRVHQLPDQYKQLVYYTLLFQMDRSLCIQIVMVLENME
jgi:predicted negative regulator of RcsB-dependent stress response